MSQENVELVVGMFETLAEVGFDGVADLIDPNAEWETSPNLPDAGTYRGLDRIRAFMEEQWTVVWGGAPSVDIERTFDLGDDVLVFIRVRGRGLHSAVPLDVRIAQLASVRDGKVARVKVYPDRNEALQAVGLSQK